jgi:hypothetical protein
MKNIIYKVRNQIHWNIQDHFSNNTKRKIFSIVYRRVRANRIEERIRTQIYQKIIIFYCRAK